MLKMKFRILKVLISVLAMLVAVTSTPIHPAYAADEYDTLRAKYYDFSTGGPSYDPADPDISGKISSITSLAQTNWDSMNKSAGRTYLWSDLASTTISAHVSQSYQRLEAMTLAYVTRGSALKNNSALLADIISAMDWMYANRYNTSVPKRGYDNWFDWQVTSPLCINNITTWIYSSLTPTQISNWHAVIDWQALAWGAGLVGANRVWACNIKIVSGIIMKNSAKITEGRDQLSPVFDYVTSGEGTYSDGSILQHTALIAYNGGYGISLMDNLTKVMYVIAGSSWDIVDPDVANIYQWIYTAFEPLFYKDNIAEMVRGRGLSRFASDDKGLTSMGALGAAVVRMALSAPSSSDRAAYKSMVKKWMLEATSPTKYADLSSITTIVQTKQIMNDATVTARPDLIMNKQYPNMARAMHLRPGFAFGISMSSSRVANYESLNNQNLKGWHTGDGMTYLYNSDLAQYKDSFWPTVNSYRMPGTTVNQNTTAAPNAKNPNSWVGGTEISGQYGISGMQYTANGATLTAKKSWFMFDNEIVNLGAGITSTDNKVAETIVENRKLTSSGNNALTVNGTAKSTALGWNETMTGVSRIHLAGNVAGSDIGYYFPTAPSVKGLRESRTDQWSSVDLYYSGPDYTTNYTRNYMNLWLDHGTNPTNGSYSYVLLPGMSSAQVDAYAASPDITVIENSGDAQAVKENNLGILGVNFWKDAVKTVSGVTSNKKASVMVRTSENGTEVSVSDPTMANTGTITLTIAQNLGPVAYKDSRITTSTSGGTTTLTVNVNGAGGKSIKAFFATPSGAPIAGYTVNEDFNDMQLGSLTGQNGWIFNNAGVAQNTVIVQPANSDATDKSLKVVTGSTSGSAEAYRLFNAPQNGYIIAEATVTADDSNWKNALIVADGSLTANNNAAQLVMQSGKIWGYNGSTKTDVLSGITNGQPYRLKVVINTSTKKYDVYVNDALLATGWSYRYAVNTLDKFSSSIAGNASSMSVDDVKVSYAPLTLTTLVDEDFNSMTLGNLNGQNGWTFDNGGVSGHTGVVQLDSGASTDKSVKLTTTSTTGKAEAYKLFTAPAGSLVIAEATVTADDNNWKNALVVSDSSLTSNGSAAHIIMQSGKIWGYNGGTQTNLVTSTTNGVPYHLKVVMNTATQKFDVYVNGELRGSQWSYRYSGLTKVDKLSSSIAGNASSSSVDDVKVSYIP
ncbi:polysaccharide lyase family 8 super-sandwich domain-containing protein [Paenibacillus koleovorans]|uniref:polysaccharide lyase family 8 super-sandwich domain-containing protein n=1 Tax=Paenibacillus koleovorans TaxID=121608 RepID=UPI000FD89978|nr:polysaccharide lyase family 8 super-sandwich domain-containing protein [Paenibacillus koleovorans]